MAIQVTISSITGESPYDIYICQTGGTSCFYMTTISSVPYIFDIPAPYNTSEAYMLKVIDNNGCTITGIEPVTTCSNVTPTITPTNTVTPSVTPSCVDVVTNGEFTTNLSGWDNDNLFPWVWSSSYGGSAESTGLDALSKIKQSCLTENCEYQITIDVEIPNSGPLFVVVAGAEGIGVPSGSNVSSQITTSGIYTFNLTCTGSSYLQIFTFDPAGNYVGFVKSITACLLNCLTPTPTQTSTPTVTPTTTLTSTPGLSPSPTSTQTSTPTNTPTATPTTTITSTPTETPTQTPTPTGTPAPPITYVGYLADEYVCGYDPLDGSATGCTLTSSSIDVRFPTSISPLLSRYYAPNPGGCSGSVYFIVGNSPNNTGPIIAGITAHNVCINACQEECPL
jgi:hypothetical protein